jgi:hypothetical protein
MDSKTINKLIRSEVWPILRKQGFSVFDSRSAFAYKHPFINVISFQSFNSHLAEGLGCTTFSFTPRLGVYVIGSPGESRVKRDKAGRLRPLEYECAFRRELKKRTPVDGFARDDIFYIDPEGRTTANCFQELKYLCSEVTPLWFRANNDLDDILHRIRRAEEHSRTPFTDATGVPGSYNWNRLLSVLLLLKHQQSPNEQTASEALDSINRLIGTVLDFSTIQSGRPNEERYAAEIHELWKQFGNFRPIQVGSEESRTLRGSLDGSAWATVPTNREGTIDYPDSIDSVSARKQFWPILKSLGFTEFTDRLAHRVSKHLVEVIEFLPMDPAERKALNLPTGLFRIGVGVFWPVLGEDGLVRKNRMGEPRPVVNECHISNWLVPEAAIYKQTAFDSFEDAARILQGPALEWLNVLRNPDSALSFLQGEDWELFWRDPLMRGYGAHSSSRRLVYMGYLKCLLGEKAEAQQYILRAEKTLHAWYFEHLHHKYENWIDQITVRISELDRLSTTATEP